MQLVSKNNFMLFLAAILVVALGIMAITMSKSQQAKKATYDAKVDQLESVSESDEVDAIEKDLEETDLTGLDNELQNIDAELEASY